jgi:mannosyltransferase
MGLERRERAPRVCYLAESFWPPDVGGLQRHAFELARRLAASGLDLFVVTRRVDPAAAARERVGGVPIRRLAPPGQWKGRGWRALPPLSVFLSRALALLVREAGRYDVVLVGGFKLLPIPAVLACAARGKPCAIRVETPTEVLEGLTTESLRRMRLAGWAVRAFRGARDALVRRADRVIAPSAEIRDALVGLGVDPRRIVQIPYGIDVERYRPVAPDAKLRLRRALGLPPDRVLVAYTGRLAVSKGLPLLARAWEELAPPRPRIHLVLVGSTGGTFDPCEAELRDAFRAHGLEDRVTFTGEVENVHEFLQAADAFVFPSLYESFGLSVVEALACGLPAVLSRVGVAAEHVVDGESALLVEPGDALGLRDALAELLDHRERWAAMGDSVRRGIAERYSLDVVTRMHREVLETLAGDPARASLPRGAPPEGLPASPEAR